MYLTKLLNSFEDVNYHTAHDTAHDTAQVKEIKFGSVKLIRIFVL